MGSYHSEEPAGTAAGFSPGEGVINLSSHLICAQWQEGKDPFGAESL